MSAESPGMSVVRLPLIELNKKDQSCFISHVGWVYENSPWVAESAWRHRPFVTVENLHAMMDRVVRSATSTVTELTCEYLSRKCSATEMANGSID